MRPLYEGQHEKPRRWRCKVDTKPLYELDKLARDLAVSAQLELHCDAKIIDNSNGSFGDVYILQRARNASPRLLAAKCPKIVRFGSKEKAVVALGKVLHEVKKTYRLSDCPWVNPITDICLIRGWPFLISRWKDGTLFDLIADPHRWTMVDRIASLIQIARVLQMAAERGIVAHQDLKPNNIFFVDLRKHFVGISDSPSLHYMILVGDFGNADAFHEFGRKCGSRPYMAPEQFGKETLGLTAGAAMDIFAVGVLAHECVCDGFHPIGKVTSDVWPRKPGVTRKWGEARVWLNWAKQEEKNLSRLKEICPAALFPAISAALAADPNKRPNPEGFEAALWQTLKEIDLGAYKKIQFQVRELESMYIGNHWPYYDDQIASLREYYARLSQVDGLRSGTIEDGGPPYK